MFTILVVLAVGCSRDSSDSAAVAQPTQVGFVPTEVVLDAGPEISKEMPREPDEKTVLVGSSMVGCVGTSTFSFEGLANAIYMAKHVDACTVTLVDGVFTMPVEGSSAAITVRLVNKMAFGDLDGDGIDEVAVVLLTDSGGY